MTDEPAPLNSQRLTWAVMLGRWVAFARAAAALPTEGDPGRLRASVADVIVLQAVWHALRNLDDLDEAERELGLDRARVLIDRHALALRTRWGQTMPPMLRELIDDAEAAWRQARG